MGDSERVTRYFEEIHIHIYVCTYIYIYMCACVCIYIDTYIYMKLNSRCPRVNQNSHDRQVRKEIIG